MTIRNAEFQDIDCIMNVYAKAKQFMTETGNGNQWVNGYPSRELVMSDISSRYCYVCIDSDNEIVGVFYFREGEDPTYLRIYEGQWLNDAPYGVIHRMGGSGKEKGVAAFCFDWCFGQCGNLRVDTHRNNVVMQHILQRNGFMRCGIIYIADGTERIAFQKIKNKQDMEIAKENNQALLQLLDEWEPKLLALPDDVISNRRNRQNRTIRQIVGHMVDSASNNTHRIIHLQYQETPLIFPDYANFGNNDRWIAIQDYQTENWNDLVQLWKYTNRHIVHVIRRVNPEKLDNEWLTAMGDKVSLGSMISDYLRHFELHLGEIEDLMTEKTLSSH